MKKNLECCGERRTVNVCFLLVSFSFFSISWKQKMFFFLYGEIKRRESEFYFRFWKSQLCDFFLFFLLLPFAFFSILSSCREEDFFICFFRFSVQVFSMHEPFQDSKKIWPQRCAHKRNRCKLTAKIKDYRMRWKGPLVIFCTVLAKLYGIKNYAIAADENESDCECVTRVMQQRDEVNMLLRNRFLEIGRASCRERVLLMV